MAAINTEAADHSFKLEVLGRPFSLSVNMEINSKYVDKRLCLVYSYMCKNIPLNDNITCRG